MPRQDGQAGDGAPGAVAHNVGSLKARFSALRTLRPFIAMVWRISPSLTLSSLLLLLVALMPVFLNEAHFNAKTYALDFGRTPERRELDYVRQTAASVETAKEVKIFGLNRFLIDRYSRLADAFYLANRALALRRAAWGGVFAAVGTSGYYVAYAYIVWRTIEGDFTIGDLSFLAASFRRLRALLEGLLTS